MRDSFATEKADAYTPPLAHKALTPLYDFAISILTRESKWRSEFIQEIAPASTDSIIDIGSGTGSLALLIHKNAPLANYLGIDPDKEAVTRARKKAARAAIKARFVVGFFPAGVPGREQPNKIITSLVLHQVPLAGKKQMIDDIFSMLPSGGKVYIADYGYQKPGLMRLLFRVTVQALDGVEDTEPNAEGIIPILLRQSGFDHVSEVSRIPTLTGSISIYAGEKPNH